MALLRVDEILDVVEQWYVDQMMVEYTHEFIWIFDVKYKGKLVNLTIHHLSGEVVISPQDDKAYTLTIDLPKDRSIYVCNKDTLTINFNTQVILNKNAHVSFEFEDNWGFACAVIFINRYLNLSKNAVDELMDNFTSNLQYAKIPSALVTDIYPFNGNIVVEFFNRKGRKEDEIRGKVSLIGILSRDKTLIVHYNNPKNHGCFQISKELIRGMMLSKDQAAYQILLDQEHWIYRLSFENREDYFACITILEFVSSKKTVENAHSISQNTPDSTQQDNTALELLIEDLNSLTGLNAVKSEVTSLINLLNLQKMRKQKGLPEIPVSLHMVFSGNPGTGKTTIARLLASIYRELGVLSKGHIIEVDRSGLVGGYIGQTAIKTQEVIQSALGGVLFIDEAYTLSRSDSSNDYGQEAIDTILKAMEDNRENLIVIVAGYPDLMKEFVNSNPGLKSRFNKYLHFTDYTPHELLTIFEGMCMKAGYNLSEDGKAYVLRFFQVKYNNRDSTFANGREVRNFFEKAVINQANRLASLHSISDTDLVTLSINDVNSIE